MCFINSLFYSICLGCLCFSLPINGQEIDTTSFQGKLDYAATRPVDEALPLLDKFIANAESKDVLLARMQKADVLKSNGQMEEAFQELIGVRDIWADLYDTTDVTYGTINYLLGVRQFRLSDYAGALNSFQKAIDILPETEENYWRALTEQSTIHANQGNFAAALRNYPRILKRRREKLRIAQSVNDSGGEKQNITQLVADIGTMKANQGILLFNIGNTKDAIPAYEEGVKLIGEAYGTDSKLYLDYAPVLMVFYRSIGQSDRAIELGRTLIRSTALQQRPAEAAFVYDAMALIYQQLSQFEQALDYAVTADSLYVAGEKSTSIERAALQLNFAKTYKELGRYEEGLTSLEVSQTILQKLNADDHPIARLGRILTAEIMGKQGKYAEQIDRLIAAKNDLDPHFKNSLTSYTALLSAKALAHEQLDEINAANQEYEELYQLFNDQIIAQFDAFSEEEQLSWQKTLIGYMHRVQNFALRYPTNEAIVTTALDLELLFRGIAFGNRKQMLNRIRNSPSADLQSKYETWLAIRKKISAQYRKPEADAKQIVDSLDRLALSLENELTRQSQEFKMARTIPRWKSISQRLEGDEVFIDFVAVDKYQLDERIPGTVIIAYVIQANGKPPQLVPLPGLGDLTKLSATKTLYAPRTTGHRGPSLHQLIYTPLRHYLEAGTTIHYTPSGILHRINLGAIPVNAERTLSETNHVRRISQVAEWISSKPATSEQKATAALFGGINFENADPVASNAVAVVPTVIKEEAGGGSIPDAALRGLKENGWEPLPYTSNEVTRIAELLNRNEYRTSLYTDAAATEKIFKQFGSFSPSPRVIHLASHGYFFPENTTGSGDTAAKTSFASARHPLVRSGLILAGANRAWRGEDLLAEQEDGILTAYEIAEMDLTGTELVVLSACETGLGDIDGSEGVFGLQRALKMAGVKYILMSLWSVKDQKTYEFMTNFYAHWQGGKTIPEAYRAAQAEIRRKYAQPFAPRNWAGFVLLE